MAPKKSTHEVSEAALKAKTAKRVAKFERDDASGVTAHATAQLAALEADRRTRKLAREADTVERRVNKRKVAMTRGSMTHLTVKQRVEIFDRSEANKRREGLEKLRKRSDRNPASIKAFTARSNAKWNPVELAKRKLVKTARILFCDVCSVAFPRFRTDWHQRHHNSLPRHKANVAAANAKTEAKAAVEPEFEPGWKKEFDE
ncbi:hypothetical protein NCU03580 [Neurospora crassa OR74A]|uniref:Uncharacterized protein n=2 Tax=Neurospora crassa TaxID=5141 RepID=Q1K4S6_NEUCR|nr:hypothetical protein NCU03580 [Neurospora crassa OR74A]EAA26783.1 hypothetical protein NCU03580 [Neurospora crassa OR74A]CAD70295.1 hypothetical protein [Neurospora crassa]|eukprot:XP_956019.1 hypothetical protein NCU03580 [Neurospora crassa OR74A]